MVLPASDPIGGVSIISGTVSRKNKEAYFVGNGGTGSEREGGGQWAEDGGRDYSHDHGHHDIELSHRHTGDVNSGVGSCKSHKQAFHGHAVGGKGASHGTAAMRAGTEAEGRAGSHGREHHAHGHHGHNSGHGHNHGHGHDGGARGGGDGGKSMNLWAMLVHAVVDAFSSAIVCAQGKEGKSLVCRCFFRMCCCFFLSCLPR